MLAFGLSVLIFFSCFVVGYTVFWKQVFSSDRHLAFFLSPVVGLGILIVLINFINRLGLPVKEFAWLLFGLIAVCAIVTVRRIVLAHNLMKNAAFLFTLPILTLSGCWPMLRYGFHWLSYVNEDMDNYVLGAMKYYQSGFFEKSGSRFYAGTDYSQVYYYFEKTAGIRPGSELFLAFVSAFHHGDALQIFMPTIVALQMVLIATAVGLVRVSLGVKRWQTITALFLLTFLPLMNLGFLYQLIGQVGGLAFAVGIITVVTILLQSEFEVGQKYLYFLFALLLSAQLIWYPEIVPFVALPIIICLFTSKKISQKRLWLGLLGSTLLSVAILNKYFLQALRFVLSQISSTTNVGSLNRLQLFPYFLKPHGLPAIFGLSPLNKLQSEPWESILVFGALVFFLTLATTPFIKPRKLMPFEVVILVMIFVLIFLIRSDNGFGSYKLVMYVQPFLVCVFILLLGKSGRHFTLTKSELPYFSLLWTALGILVATLLFMTTQFYVSASTATTNKGFSQIPEVSSSNLADQIIFAEKLYNSQMGPILSPSISLTQSKLEAIASKGKPILFLSRDPFQTMYPSLKMANSTISRQNVFFPDKSTKNNFSQLKILSSITNKPKLYLLPNDIFASLNKSSYVGHKSFWNYQLVKNPINYLVFVNSGAAPVYDDTSSVQSLDALFPPEPNPMVPGAYMQSIGNVLLLQVVNFQPHSQLVLDMSSTVLGQYLRRIPNITVVGANRVLVHPEGSGSTRIAIPNVVPLKINNEDYFEIKFDQKLKAFPSRSSWLSKLYGSQVVLDPRLISTFLSNLSLISASSVLSAKVPSQVRSFPKDLENPGLNYSGAYEDGWMSQSFNFDLKATGSKVINLSGYIPSIKNKDTFNTAVTLYIDGLKGETFNLNVGNFSLNFQPKSALTAGTIHKIEFRFEKSQRLPLPDGRPASIFMTYLGFKGSN